MKKKPLLLDLFCGAGGCAKGYQLAGFHVVGIDIDHQRHYCGDEFVQADALEWLNGNVSEFLMRFAAVHASPPCHHYSTGTQHRKNAGKVYPDLLPGTQHLLRRIGRPYVIENVMGAKSILKNPIMLCGGMFNLGVSRHRLFETNWHAKPPEHICNKDTIDADLVSVTRHGPPARWYKKNPGRSFNIKTWHQAMGINWMNRKQLTQAIPPAYTEFIGKQLLAKLA